MKKQIKEKDLIPREITLICGICKKKATHINCECDDCYIKGALHENEKGFELGKKQALEEELKFLENIKVEEEWDIKVLIKDRIAQIKKEMK